MNKKYLLVLIAALGYFVDIYDLILFNIVRKESLIGIGVTPENLENAGITLFNWQMSGMLIGGLFWGILGDKRGRVQILFGSILMYSIANIANAFVTDTTQYAIIRFIAGLGLAGELGAGITLIAETMDKETRGYGTMIVVAFGALGAVLAAAIAARFDWQWAYVIGGVLGLGLLALRMGAMESGMFQQVKNSDVPKGAFLSLFTNGKRFYKYLCCIMIGLPIWFIVAVLIALASKFAAITGVIGEVKVADCVVYLYIGLSSGDVVSGFLSQWWRSRKKVVIAYLLFSGACIVAFLFWPNLSATQFYILCYALGFGTGFWALFVTIAAEQFGTNIRSTVSNTVPNFVRGAVVPITLSFKYLEGVYGNPVTAALIVGGVCLGLSLFAISQVPETFAKDLDYNEVD